MFEFLSLKVIFLYTFAAQDNLESAFWFRTLSLLEGQQLN